MPVVPLTERLRNKARASFETNKSFGRKGKEWAIDTEVEWQAADRIALLEGALRGADAWLNRWASHVGNCKGGASCTCGLTAIQHETAQALAETEVGG